MKVSFGVDIGGTNVVVGVVAEDGRILSKRSFPTRGPRPAAEVCSDIVATIDSLKPDISPQDEICGIGIGSPGIIYGGVVQSASNLQWKEVPLAEMLKERTGLRVELGNDANVAAFGEYRVGGGHGANSLVMVTIGTGIGGGMVFDGKIQAGFNGGGGEFGHMSIVAGGRECSCGRKGCWEMYGSATALVRASREKMARRLDSAMWQVCGGDIRKVDGRTAFDAMRLGDTAGAEVVDEFVGYLAEGIRSIVTLLQPEILCIGGGVSAEGDFLMKPLAKKINEDVLFTWFPRKTKIVAAALRGDAGLVGAALLVM